MGNDFLPHSPSLEIREGAIELLMAVYKVEAPRLGWLVDGEDARLDRVEAFIRAVSAHEAAIFAKRARMLHRDKARRERDKQAAAQQAAGGGGGGRGGGGRGAGPPGGRGGKWTAARPSDAYMASLTAVRAPAPAVGCGGDSPAAAPGPPVLLAPAVTAGPPASNKSAAALLRERIAAGGVGKRGAREPARAAVATRGAATAAAAKGEPDEPDTKRTKGGEVEAKPEGAGATAAPPPPLPLEGSLTVGTRSHVTVATDGAGGVKVEVDEAVTSVSTGAGGAAAASFWSTVKADGDAAAVAATEAAAGDAAGGVDDDGEEGFALPDDADADEPATRSAAASAAAAAAEAAAADAAAALETTIAATMRERGDKFDAMVVHEEAIALGRDGWRERYYEAKVGLPAGPEQTAAVRGLVAEYVRGLAWVLKYYYAGVASWTWFYPYHYAPFASDLTDLSSVDASFDVGVPFAPFNQLMGVLPAASAHALPDPYQPLFALDSPIADFYPRDFEVDMNGKRFAWQGVALLPFIDEGRLLAATGPLEASLAPDDAARNSLRDELLFMASSHPLAKDAFEVADEGKKGGGEVERPIDASLTGGLGGRLLPPYGDPCPPTVRAPMPGVGPDLTPNAAVVARYRLPAAPGRHVCRPLPGQPLEPPVVSENDLPPPKPLWHEDRRGGPGGGRGGGGGRGWGGWGGGAQGGPPGGAPWGQPQHHQPQWGAPPPPGMHVHAQYGYAYGAGAPGAGGPPPGGFAFRPVGGGQPYAPQAHLAGQAWGGQPPAHGGGGAYGGGWAAPPGQFGAPAAGGWAAPPGQFGQAPPPGGAHGGDANPYAHLQRGGRRQ